MTVTVNAERRELPEGATVRTLLETLNLANATCAVEVNRTLIRKAAHPSTPLREGDTIEIVTLVGGG
ncbi:MAG: sulfur carrier protein ThiS [Phycisphaerales bacterium]|nr:sulfur carrier protein ThiS [Phycisphaerales bacterium]